jgi:hypothetical protein
VQFLYRDVYCLKYRFVFSEVTKLLRLVIFDEVFFLNNLYLKFQPFLLVLENEVLIEHNVCNCCSYVT